MGEMQQPARRRYPLTVGRLATDFSRLPEGEKVALESAHMLPGGQYLWRIRREDNSEADVLEGFLLARAVE